VACLALATAAVAPRLTEEELVTQSERIVHGRVNRSWPAWDPPHKYIWTQATLPTVTVGGAPVTVIGAALSPGSVGLYQIAIQLPAALASGKAAVQASAGGVTSPTGVNIFVK